MDISAQRLITSIKGEQQRLALSLAENPRTDYASYQEAVGRYTGLTQALDIINSLLDEEKNSDRDQSQRFRKPAHAYG